MITPWFRYKYKGLDDKSIVKVVNFKEYRKKFRLNLFNGLFLNTESILRPRYYVLSKICYFVIKLVII